MDKKNTVLYVYSVGTENKSACVPDYTEHICPTGLKPKCAMCKNRNQQDARKKAMDCFFSTLI